MDVNFPSAPLTRAFSLVELSIVLVILGLLVGGVLSGQSLIKAAAIRKQMNQINDIEVATLSFKDKYFSLPGDIVNGTNFFGTSDPAGNPIGNGDGDGDGIIMSTFYTGAAGDCLASRPDPRHAGGSHYEGLYFFQHLLMAKLFNYSPTNGGGDQWPKLALNPQYHIMVSCTMTNNPTSNAFVPLNRRFRSPVTILPWDASAAGMTGPTYDGIAGTPAGGIEVDDARVIDHKIDDGNPSSGSVWALGGCARGATTYAGAAATCISPYSVLAKTM
jgi:prepilin-type N-terminal cleavage/methylation domain-containing protein